MSAIKLPCPECGKPTFTVNSRWPPTKIMGLAGSKCPGCGHVLSESERDDALLMGPSMKAELPVFATLGRAFVAVFSTRFFLSGFFIKCLLAYFVANELHAYIFGFIYGLTGRHSETLYQTIFIFSKLTALPVYFIVAPFAIAIHRLIIMGDDLPSKPFKHFFSKRNINFVVYGILLTSPLIINGVISQLGGKYGFPLWIGIVGLLSIPYLVILFRVVIYMPFIAIDNRQTLSRCWEITRGSTWRFFGMMLIATVIVFLIQRFVATPLGEVVWNLPPGEIYSSVRMFVGIMSIDLITNFIFFVSGGWMVAIVSHAFNYFREEKGFDILEEKG